ncbi:ABC transporter permease [Subtercola frigoramans]|uniref:ABC-2 type transport system permease protein n=1 Tax=Subtercola frigoramans TaxID=120298 RepID=A0ABS2L3I1_9MICO|nr:ABC transporter permease subunit [Subtercola frigoramans]MBM7471574.1 ABC-2 type transport system permease protein [Subtercola frigoramans]
MNSVEQQLKRHVERQLERESVGILFAQRARRDRVQLIIWIAGISLLAYASLASVNTTFPSAVSRVSILQVATANPVLLMLRGLPDGISNGGFGVFELFSFLGLLAGFMSTFLVTRHTRAEEESGRAELIGATPASRRVPTLATLVLATGANLVLGIAVAVGYLAAGGNPENVVNSSDPSAAGAENATALQALADSLTSTSPTPSSAVWGSVLAGASVAGVGLTSMAVALIVSQLVSTSRGANGISAAFVGFAYLAAGIGNATGAVSPDGTAVAAAWPVWLSPIGWGQQTHPFTQPTALPLLLDVVVVAGLVALALVVQSSRDVGASLFAARTGRTTAHSWLSGPTALAWRLHWPTITGWALGSAVLGAIVGTLGPAMLSAVSTDSSITAALKLIAPGDTNDVMKMFISAIFGFAGILAAGSAIQSIIRLRQEEARGTAELVLASAVSRVRYLLGYLSVGLAAVVIVLLAAAIPAALLLNGSGYPDAWQSILLSTVAQLPVALVYLCGLALVFTLLPRATAAIGWGTLTAGIVFGLYGAALGLPEWLRNTSPFTHTPVTTGSNTDWTGGIWMLVLSLLAALAALALMRRRELQ